MGDKTVLQYVAALRKAFIKALLKGEYSAYNDAFEIMINSLIINELSDIINAEGDKNERQLVEFLLKKREIFGLVCSEINLIYGQCMKITQFDDQVCNAFPFLKDWYNESVLGRGVMRIIFHF